MPPPRTAHLPGSSRSKETGHLRPRAPGLRLEPAVAAEPKGGLPRRTGSPRPLQPPGPQGVPRLVGPGQDARDSRGVLAGAQAGQKRSSRPYFTSARREAVNRVGLAGGTTRPTGAQLLSSHGRSSSLDPSPLLCGAVPPGPAPPCPAASVSAAAARAGRAGLTGAAAAAQRPLLEIALRRTARRTGHCGVEPGSRRRVFPRG